MRTLTSEAKFDVRLMVIETGRNVCFGGGDAPDTSGQNEAAKTNAEIAKQMWAEYQKVYLPMEREFATEALNYDTPEKREEMAGLANADVAKAVSGQRESTERNLSSMGLNPASGVYQSEMAKNDIRAVGMQAGAMNNARRNVENMGYARKQDAISIGKGMPGTASASMAQAGNQFAQVNNAQMQHDQNQANSVSGMVGGGAALYGMMKADGGYIDGEAVRVEDEDDEQHLAGGGMAGNPRMQSLMNSPTIMPVGGGGMNPAMSAGLNAVQTYKSIKGAADMGKGLASTAGKISEHGLAEVATNNAITTGLNVPGLNVGSQQAAMLAEQNLGLGAEALASTAEAGAVATEAAAGTAAAATEAGAATAAAAEGAGLLGSLGSAGGAALTALGPVGLAVGAGLLATQLFKKDGGKVSRKDLRKGGKVNGPGTETSDSIPARLSDGEYVLNAETVKMIGKPALDKLNQAGLNKRYGLADARRAA